QRRQGIGCRGTREGEPFFEMFGNPREQDAAVTFSEQSFAGIAAVQFKAKTRVHRQDLQRRLDEYVGPTGEFDRTEEPNGFDLLRAKRSAGGMRRKINRVMSDQNILSTYAFLKVIGDGSRWGSHQIRVADCVILKFKVAKHGSV